MRYRAFREICAAMLLFLSLNPIQAAEIQLVDRGGIFTLPVKINGALTLQFMVDTGTPEVVVPDDIASTLIQSGTIQDTDFLPGSPYTLTDGSVLRSSAFNIRELEIGGMRVNDVRCSIDSEVPELVLGESLLTRFDSWELDNARKILILENVKGLMIPQREMPSARPSSTALLSSASNSEQQALAPKAKPQQPYIVDIRNNRFGSFHYICNKQKQENVFSFQLMAGARPILSDESYLPISSLRILKDLPSHACQSAITSLYSGGAHCCTRAILLTICGSQEKAFAVDLSSSGVEQLQFLDLNKDGNRQISIPDFSFAYYSATDTLSLSFASSPIVRRLLVFQAGKWVPAPRGLFQPFYLGLLQKTESDMKKLRTRSNDEQDYVSMAIMRTFYSIMAGRSDNECRNTLASSLPRSWRSAAGKIYADINTAIASFQPVTELQ